MEIDIDSKDQGMRKVSQRGLEATNFQYEKYANKIKKTILLFIYRPVIGSKVVRREERRVQVRQARIG